MTRCVTTGIVSLTVPFMDNAIAAAGRPTIMIVDNDLLLSSLLEAVFKDEGLHVLTSANGQEALDLLGTVKAPQLILSDMNMPVMGGAELFKCLKSKLATKNIPIILSSALEDIEVTSQELGASACLKKPYDLEALTNLVKKHLN